jgi:hypothetical protein
MKPPEYRKRLKLLCREYGWAMELKSAGHYRLTKPDRPFIVCSASTSDRRALQNTRSMMRRFDRQADE